ncbi:hypothetical protein LCGC14_2533710 [marine sediment metagenome]|uniref:Uncharacterized protein n=1 Tax=marine sediment metagenome TaxID=412755 RepID=A0A0F9ASR7_9ZZZZ
MLVKLDTINSVYELLDEADWYDISELKSELAKVDEGTGWLVQISKCRICNEESLDIMPVGADSDNLECHNCGNMTMQEKEIPEWE